MAKIRTMTEGHPLKLIFAFSLPLMFGNVFQQFYNMADTVIVGKFVGTKALAAVGSTGTIMFLILGFVLGMTAGFTVLTAQKFGAGDMKAMRQTVGGAAVLSILVTIVLTAGSMLFMKPLLRFMHTPSDIFDDAYSYIMIICAGIAAQMLYNLLASVLRALGNSKVPLYFLILSALLNIVLDLVLVGIFHFGVGAAAFATIISQFVSAFLCLRRLMRSPEEYRVCLKKIRFDTGLLRQIIANGLPAGFQNSVISLANVVVQSNINRFGKMAMAGCGAYSKIEGFGFLPITCFAMALTTFVSQNLGAGQYERAKKGASFGILCSIITAELVGIFIYAFSPLLISAFNNDPQVIINGTAQARTVTLFYFLLAFSHCIAGILRGAGKSTVPMLVMMVCWCIIRVTYITVTVHFVPDIRVVFWAYPLTWFLSSVVFLRYFLKGSWVHGFER